MKRISSYIPVASVAICTSIFSSYTGEEDIFILTLVFILMGKLLKEILDENDVFLDYFSFVTIGMIILHFGYYTIVACYYTTPTFLFCAVLSIISGYAIQCFEHPKN